MDKQVEMTTELRRARGWILGVGTVMLVYNLVAIHVVNAQLPGEIKTRATAYVLGIFMFLLAMWWLAGRRPVLACVLALLGFWGLALYMTMDGSSILQGIVMKVLFTLALIRGIKSANRAEQLKRELAQVFS
jgi:hypothetical protein